MAVRWFEFLNDQQKDGKTKEYCSKMPKFVKKIQEEYEKEVSKRENKIVAFLTFFEKTTVISVVDLKIKFEELINFSCLRLTLNSLRRRKKKNSHGKIRFRKTLTQNLLEKVLMAISLFTAIL